MALVSMSSVNVNNKKKRKNKAILPAILLGIIGAGAIIGSVTWFYTRKSNNITTKSDISTSNGSSSSSSDSNSNSGNNSSVLDNGKVTLTSSGNSVNQTLNFGNFSDNYEYWTNQNSYLTLTHNSSDKVQNATGTFDYNASSLDTITASVDLNIPDAKYNWYLISAPTTYKDLLSNLTYNKDIAGYLVCENSNILSYTSNSYFQSLLKTLSGTITLKCVVTSNKDDIVYVSDTFNITGYYNVIDTKLTQLNTNSNNPLSIVLFKLTNDKDPVFTQTYDNTTILSELTTDLKTLVIVQLK